MSGAIFYCDDWCGRGEGWYYKQLVGGGQGMAKYHTKYNTVHQTKNYLAENVNSVAVEKPCPTAVFSQGENLWAPGWLSR